MITINRAFGDASEMTINLDEPIPEYTVDDFYKMHYKRRRMIRRAENLLLPRRFKGFSVKIKKF